MKAPEKIYLEREKETDKIHHLWGRTPVISSLYEHIEYTRTDAFIEKALKWLEENVMKYLITTICAGMDVPDIKDEFFDDFKKHLKGE